MPLLDHFRPPVEDMYPWESFHANWAIRIGDALTDILPPGFVVAEQTHAGNHLEIDVATFEESTHRAALAGNGSAATAVAAPAWSPPKPALSLPGLFPDSFEVRVFQTVGGRTLVAAIELVSPGNKDRPEERRAFAAKSINYLCQGVSLIVIDIVTTLQANLHNETMQLMSAGEEALIREGPLYAVAYRPVLRDQRPAIDLWPTTFALGRMLPTLPLRLTGDLFVPVDFEATYLEVCRRRRLA
jgi:hypothetical protein